MGRRRLRLGLAGRRLVVAITVDGLAVVGLLVGRRRTTAVASGAEDTTSLGLA